MAKGVYFKTLEHRRNLSLSQKGKKRIPLSEEHKKKISLYYKTHQVHRPLSSETIEKIK